MRRNFTCLALFLAVLAVSAYANDMYVSIYRASGTGASLSVTVRTTQVPLTSKWAVMELARAKFVDSQNHTGWGRLTVVTNSDEDDVDTAYAAGYGEGYTTVPRTEQHAYNSGVLSFNITEGLRNFLAVNKQFVSSSAVLAANMAPGMPDRAVFYQSNLLHMQQQGLYDGYAAGRRVTHPSQLIFNSPIPSDKFELMTLGGDLEDLESLFEEHNAILRGKPDWDETRDVTPVYNHGRCSSIVRRPSTSNDLFVSQVTWSSFNSMVRIWKSYEFSFRAEPGSAARVPAKRMSFSSYPATLFSGDDFYVMDNGLVSHETTIGNDNGALARAQISPLCILEWVRNMVANRLATSAAHWHDVYSRFNSGTYNNMNIVVDYNQLPNDPKVPLPASTVVISEQIPGHVIVTDVTDMVNRDGYFASYNMPMNHLIRQLSLADEAVKENGQWFSYDGHPRALIFRRDAPNAESLEDMQRMMRSCDFKNDPYSSQMETCKYKGMTNCWPEYTSENCLATRGDLNPKDGVWGLNAFGLRNHVASDAKISTRADVLGDAPSAHIISGPPGIKDNPASTPDFVFSQSPFKQLPHAGIPDKVVYDWQRFNFYN